VSDRQHKTWVEIDLEVLRSNFRLLKQAIGPNRQIILVVKSDAYGHGAVAVTALAAEEGIKRFAVASVDEGSALRRADIDGEILLLHPPLDFEIPEVVRWRLSPAISSEETARLYSRMAGGNAIPVHVEIDTGLSRLGLDWQTAAESMARIAAIPNLKIAGTYTHYRAVYRDAAGSVHQQTERFGHVLEELKNLGIDPGLRHAASSYPTALHAETYFDAIRVGIIAYGAVNIPADSPLSGIRPALSVRSRVMLTRRVASGEWVHYNDSFQATRDMAVAVVPIGYGMGYSRHFSNNAEMLIRGKRCPVVGVIGMDMTMVDVSGLPELPIGEIVTVIGRDQTDELRATELAKRAGTISYELTCRLGNALPRYNLCRAENASAGTSSLQNVRS
jgi:alanine racemase